MIIDMHAHYLPQATLDALAQRSSDFPSIELIQGDGKYQLAFGGGKPTRPLMLPLRDPTKRLAWMAEQGIDLQISGGWLDAFAYGIPAEECADWSRFQNEMLIEACKQSGGKLAPLATVPMQDGELAAQVLREAMDAGMKGAMIGTQPKGGRGCLDDPDLDVFWATAAEIGATIIVHPEFGSDDDRLHDMGMMNACGRVTDVTIALSRLLMSGHMMRFEGLKLVASTGGGALPYMVGRLTRNTEFDPGDLSDPVESLKRMYFDSIVFRTDVMNFLTNMVGSDRVMLGSDTPFPIGDYNPRRVIEQSGYSEAEQDAMRGGTAAKLFGIE